ncbi:MAG: hypothetical protein WC455_06845 [Dehalococcoidia bacterium]
MIYWAPLLHFYQPPTQLHWVLQKVCIESYRPLVELFTDLPYAKVTININAVLTEMLYDHGFNDVVKGIRELARRGQVEFTGSGKYHPILPLIPQSEIERQISHNHKTNKRLLGKLYNPKGFFPPEMCYSKEMLKPIVDSGHQWIIISGVACPVTWPTNIIHQIDSDRSKIAVFFRDNILSNKISFHNIDATGFIEHLKHVQTNQKSKSDTYVVTAMDAETFGHHIQDWEKLFLAKVYQSLEVDKDAAHKSVNRPKSSAVPPSEPQHAKIMTEQHDGLLQSREVTEGKQIKAVAVSDLLDIFPRGETIEPKPSSWSTENSDIDTGNPYPLWQNPNNTIHQYQWEHLDIALAMTNKAVVVAKDNTAKQYADNARTLLDAALHSDQFWWASRKPWWDPNLIHRGLIKQHEVILNAYKAISLSYCSPKIKKEYYYKVVAARDISNKIIDEIFVTP